VSDRGLALRRLVVRFVFPTPGSRHHSAAVSPLTKRRGASQRIGFVIFVIYTFKPHRVSAAPGFLTRTTVESH